MTTNLINDNSNIGKWS